jgi:formate hydrogenlyase subunit 3/multisubunit Na+/H+ antiporter MnhD subunit
MVAPILIIVIALGSAFLIPLVSRSGGAPHASIGLIPAGTAATRSGVSGAVLFYLALGALVAIPASRLLPLASGAQAAETLTAGARPPLSINLRLGLLEAIVLSFVNLVGLLSSISAATSLYRRGGTSYVLMLMIMLGANGLVLTRDLFNTFVFLEILSIGTYGVIALDDERAQYAAGFKYLIAGGISSVLFLLGTVYLYRLTGTLHIDGMIQAVEAGALASGDTGSMLAIGAGFVAPFLLFGALVIELKAFPANGWAIDTYQAANTGVAATISAVSATAVLATLWKVMPVFPGGVVTILLWVGLITFFAANLLGLRQTNPRRMLGYSSVAQVGLVAAVLALMSLDDLGGFYLLLVPGGLVINHVLAKAGLFWIAGAAAREELPDGDSAVEPNRTVGSDVSPHHTHERTRRSGYARAIGPIAGVALVALALALIGMPPFPAFWAKWQLVHTLLASDRIALLVMLLLGTLFEAVYILRWSGRLIARPERSSGVADGSSHGSAAAERPRRAPSLRVPPPVAAGLAVATVLLATTGVFSGWTLGLNDRLIWAPFFFAAALLLLEWLPSRIKGALAIAAMGLYAWLLSPVASGLALILGGVFAAGSVAAMIATLSRRATPFGTYTLYLLAGTALTGLVIAREPIAFFLLWELMTIGSYLLIARSSRQEHRPSPKADVGFGRLIRGDGPGARTAAVRYAGFSVAAALLLMVGLILASHGHLRQAGGALVVADGGREVALPQLLGADAYVQLPLLGSDGVSTKNNAAGAPGAGSATAVRSGTSPGAWTADVPRSSRIAILVLMGLAFLVKMGAMGVHVWLPDAYAEADDETTAFLSSALSKAGVLGVLVLIATMGPTLATSGGAAGEPGVDVRAVLGWIGALTALFGALVAVFQEDVKKLLAYSSLSQVGYMVMGIALATHLGWVAGVYNAVNHFLFKGLLFLGITGVIMRTGSRYMYEMGGLIKRMPLTFISVLMAIIALSGVPPLSGFGGKWLIYGALLESGWYVQAGVAFFASTVAFLYLFRLIYSVFLGQLKDNLREVREAPVAVVVPQLVLLGVLMLISMYPNVILDPIIAGVEPFLATSVQWDGYTVITVLGYWNGNVIMWVTMAVFVVPLVWLFVVMRRPQKVEQFNMVYAAERPERPETTHFAHNFFAPYRKALGFLAAPGVKRGWEYVFGGVGAFADAVRRLYSGNAQTYALHIMIVTVLLYFIAGGLS